MLVKKVLLNIILSLFLITSVFCLAPSFALAAPSTKLFDNTTPTVTGPQIGTSDTEKSVEEIVIDIISNIILPLIGAIALIFIMYGGILFITSAGDPEKLTKAKKTLLWAVIGIIIVVLSYGLVVSLDKIINNLV